MRAFISILLIVNLLVSTIGVQLHRIYCYCTGDITVLLWHPQSMECEKENGCNADTQPSQNACHSNQDAVHIDNKLCCQQPKSDDGISDDNSCGREDHIFTKLKIDLKHHLYSFDLDGFAPAFLPQSADFFFLACPIFSKKAADVALRGPPLRPFGKKLLPHIQSWLC